MYEKVRFMVARYWVWWVTVYLFVFLPAMAGIAWIGTLSVYQTAIITSSPAALLSVVGGLILRPPHVGSDGDNGGDEESGEHSQ